MLHVNEPKGREGQYVRSSGSWFFSEQFSSARSLALARRSSSVVAVMSHYAPTTVDLLYAEVEEDDAASISSVGTTDSFLIQYRSGAINGASRAYLGGPGWRSLR